MVSATSLSTAASTVPAPLVLVVDDYLDAQVMYGMGLRREGFEVAFAADGDEAVEAARSLHPAVIVMDLALRTRDGWSATRELRGDPVTCQIPVIAVSGHVTPECIAAAYDAGCEVFLAKPCLPDALAAEVRQVLDRHTPAPKLVALDQDEERARAEALGENA